MPVSRPGSIITRGLGSSLLVTRGYGGTTTVVVIEEITAQPFVESPRGKRHPSPYEEKRRKPFDSYVVKAKIIEINDVDVAGDYAEHVKKAYYDGNYAVKLEIDNVVVQQRSSMISIEAAIITASGSKVESVTADFDLQETSDKDVVVKASILPESADGKKRDTYVIVKSVKKTGKQ